MLSEGVCKIYKNILEEELLEATGCTEPIALALVGAKVKKVLGAIPDRVDVYCSGNMIKNVKGVVVPNSGGLRGIDCAVLLGIIGGNPDDDLQVVSKVSDEDRLYLKQELQKKYVKTYLAQDVPTLYIRVVAYKGEDSCEVELQKKHTNVNKIIKNGTVIFDNHTDENEGTVGSDKSVLNIKDIIEYAENVDINDVKDVILRQVKDNEAIALEGLNGSYGAEVGKSILEHGTDVYSRAKAKAAAGSDARMGGCPMPVVINSGSGNQGMTISNSVYEFAKELDVSEEKLIRSLVIANLVAVHQKKYIGALSAYCGATSAATGAACGIAWLKGGDYEVISKTISNSIVSIGGMVCDGAKGSCASKIALALDCSLRAMDMAFKDRAFTYGEGLVKKDVEGTIQAVGRMAKDGMKSTDIEILNIMLED